MSSINLTLSALVVAGGGGGGGNSSIGTGGGGAGGVTFSQFTIATGQTYNVIVGNGGAGGASINGFSGFNGENSSLVGLLTAVGGGGGAGISIFLIGANGGSGGGGAATITLSGHGGTNTGTQGFLGGDGRSGVYPYGGGGGGAGQNGFNAVSNNGGNGGKGIINPIPGSTVGQLSAGNYWIAGGGGGSSTFAGIGLTQGGLGGGGNGSPNSPTNGTDSTGGGGGGGYTANGGNGGNGVVVLAIPSSQYSGITTGSPSVSVVGSNTILTFTSNGSYTALASPYYTLTQDANAGTLFFNQGFDINKDIIVTFDYVCYGAGYTGSEGFSVFFTSTLSGLSGGGPGPGLCYSPVLNVNSISPVLTSFKGVLYGALGIGFDVTGNFGTNFYGANGLAVPVQNSITIRDRYDNNYGFLYNSGDLNTNAFPFPYKLYQQTQTPTYNRIRVRLTDFGQRVAIDIKRPVDYTFSNFINYTLPSSAWWPDSVYCGLGFATGVDPTTFKVKNFNINGVYLDGYRTWNYGINQTTLSGSYFNTTSTGLSSLSSFLYVGSTINIINSVTTGPYLSGSPLILITPNGTAGLQSGDQYIIIQ